MIETVMSLSSYRPTLPIILPLACLLQTPADMPGQSTQDASAQDTNTFYRRTLHVLSDAAVPFLVGGSHAFLEYTGIARNTKDFDVFLRRDDLTRAMDALNGAGYRTELTFPHWLAKAKQGNDVVDLVFSSGNGVCCVDDTWFQFATEADVLGMPVKFAPVEELLWQKSFVMERERYDGADIAHILRTCGDSLDWDRLVQRFDSNWELLFSCLVLFSFIYPSERHRIPGAVLSDLSNRLQQQIAEPRSDDRVCRDLLGAQYLPISVGTATALARPRGVSPGTLSRTGDRERCCGKRQRKNYSG